MAKEIDIDLSTPATVQLDKDEGVMAHTNGQCFDITINTVGLKGTPQTAHKGGIHKWQATVSSSDSNSLTYQVIFPGMAATVPPNIIIVQPSGGGQEPCHRDDDDSQS